MDEHLDSERMGAWRAFLTAHRRLVDRLGDELADAQALPLTWYDVLVNINHAPDRRLRMTDLADHLLISRSGLTRLVDRMAAAGLVDRVPCPTDRRGLFVVLTPEGRAVLEGAAPTHLAGVARHFGAHLDQDEAAVLRAALERIVGALDASAGS